jgi:NAD dependent epimerase/dehydratase
MGTSRLPKPDSARRVTPAATESIPGSDGSENRLGGRRFLVTGAGGFIGGHLCARLVLEGASVRGFVRYNSRSSHGTLDWLDASIAGEVDVVRGDLRDYESVAQAMVGSDVVIHLGAQIAIPYSYVNPRDFFETNVLGALNVAQAALQNDVALLVHTSTSEVYGTARTVPITEEHPLEPQSPYAASKLAADKLMDSYHRTFDLPVVILRPFNTYGPFQSARAVISTIISQALDSNEVHLGSLAPRRDLTFVDDTVAALVAASAATDAVGRTVQLGTGTEVSVQEMVDLVGRLMGKELLPIEDPDRIRPPNSEVTRLVSDPSLALELLGWRAQTDLPEGLSRTIEWIRANRQLYRGSTYVF